MALPGQLHSREHRARRTLRAGAAAAAVTLVTAACGVPPSPGRSATNELSGQARAMAVEPSGPAFPRNAAYFLEHDGLPPAETLARFDLVVIDSEWDNRVPPSYFATLRQHNPDITLLAYVNVVDRPPELGLPDRWADRYALWQFENSTESRFPEQWLAQTGDGTPVSEWPHTVMTNLTDRAPMVNGQIFAEYAADWIVNQVWSSGTWDGIFLDVWGDGVYGASHDRWDTDGDGTDEPNSVIYGAGKPWERGVDLAERILRQRLPEAILVANGNRTLRCQQLDGRVWESFADQEVGRDPADDLRSYVTVSAEGAHRLPGTAITINQQRGVPLSPEDLRRARFFLSGTLLQDGYWAPTGTDYGQLVYYEEMDGAGLGTGYLGHPLVPSPTPSQLLAPFSGGTGQLADGFFRRDFEHGIVLHNVSTEPRTVTLDRPYRRLRGTQDPVTNDGQVVQTVTVPSHDGLILLRENG